MDDGIPGLLAEHARLMDQKEELRTTGQTPPTKINYELTELVHRIVEQARADKSDEVRSLLAREADAGHSGAESALEWLEEDDPWWTGRDG